MLFPIAALVVMLADTSSFAPRPSAAVVGDSSLTIAVAVERAAVAQGVAREPANAVRSLVAFQAPTRRCIAGALACGHLGAYLTWNAGFGRWWRPARAATQPAR